MHKRSSRFPQSCIGFGGIFKATHDSQPLDLAPVNRFETEQARVIGAKSLTVAPKLIFLGHLLGSGSEYKVFKILGYCHTVPTMSIVFEYQNT